ncbi:acireductone synthase [Lysobacter ciconiae]|uniref:Enolase-phosphatase E1 n=1 Tax=Novilysobacter ciconiae TaxID=2781022 RepID=A0A7S6ZT23_9GAMM|nr:acireductone synthase [Lysobacter ciconiae]QOW20465.1 acireductone synthase [Lysobacter ciconiae]
MTTSNRVVLTDIEGTTSSISFVKKVLFPFARRALPAFVKVRGHEPAVRKWLDLVATELGGMCQDAMIAEVMQGWIDEDRKHTALKALQGMIWADGYRNGDFTAHIYPDAAQALQRWHADGVPLYVFSSGSVPAQRLFFGHSDAGDLTGLFSGWFDTEVGEKRDFRSYDRIASEIDVPAARVLFLSDVVAELDAARTAGMDTVLIDRREDYPEARDTDAANGHRRLESFEGIDPAV